ncbi:MAG: cation diffusion facilitator family transporter [Propionibacteriaceae bacterium]|jgi:cation diffusion facilitator family transporter|nr:cation diffusion facilitator family transporter [Propionibacteriaceae bacterium]
MSQHQGTKAVLAAMAANIAIACMKFLAWLVTGAASMLAEAIHSVADSANQILILLGGRASKKGPTELHPFGFGRERYLSAFLVAIILFSMGGLFACYEAYHKFIEVRSGHPNELLASRWWWVPVVVLVAAIVAESFSLRTAIREARPAKGDLSWPRFIHKAKAPELPVILLEDTAALTGLGLALLGVGMTLLTGSGYWDAAGTAGIGVLLVVVAVLLAVETQSLLIGESATPEQVQAVTAAVESTAGVQGIIHMKTVHLGPDEVLVAAKIAIDPTVSGVRLAQIIDAAEANVRRASDLVGPVYLEPDVRHDETVADPTSLKEA